jgi:hypothetical protein
MSSSTQNTKKKPIPILRPIQNTKKTPIPILRPIQNTKKTPIPILRPRQKEPVTIDFIRFIRPVRTCVCNDFTTKCSKCVEFDKNVMPTKMILSINGIEHEENINQIDYRSKL